MTTGGAAVWGGSTAGKIYLSVDEFIRVVFSLEENKELKVYNLLTVLVLIAT